MVLIRAEYRFFTAWGSPTAAVRDFPHQNVKRHTHRRYFGVAGELHAVGAGTGACSVSRSPERRSARS